MIADMLHVTPEERAESIRRGRAHAKPGAVGTIVDAMAYAERLGLDAEEVVGEAVIRFRERRS